MDLNQRASGVVLHITSLPGPHGVGDFGPGAYHFVDWLQAAGQRVWQVLPMTPIGPGDSPYQSVSAFAGSPLMVALEPLVERGWLTLCDAAGIRYPACRLRSRRAVAHATAARRRRGLCAPAPARPNARAMIDWCEREAAWLDDYTLFMALEAAHGVRPWWAWACAAGAARSRPR